MYINTQNKHINCTNNYSKKMWRKKKNKANGVYM